MFNKLKKMGGSKDGGAAIATSSSKLRATNSILTTAASSRDDRNDVPSTSFGGAGKQQTIVSPTNNNNGVAPSYQDQPETDYDLGPTQLYTFIENKHWESAIERSRTTPSEVQTWISRREPDDPNKIRWRLLPLHATCVFRAPLSLIEALIVAYPDGPSLIDDQGMLPIHLACRNGASRGVVMTLLNAYPKSINVKDKKGRTPLNLVENSNSQNKDVVIEAMQAFRISFENNSLPPAGVGLRAVSPAMPAQTAETAGGTTTTTAAANVTDSSGASLSSKGRNLIGIGEREVDYENRTILFRLILKKDWDGVSTRLNLFPNEASTVS